MQNILFHPQEINADLANPLGQWKLLAFSSQDREKAKLINCDLGRVRRVCDTTSTIQQLLPYTRNSCARCCRRTNYQPVQRVVRLGQGIENKLNVNRVEGRAGPPCGIALVGLRSSLGCLTPWFFTYIRYREDEFHVRYLQRFCWGRIGRLPPTFFIASGFVFSLTSTHILVCAYICI